VRAPNKGRGGEDRMVNENEFGKVISIWIEKKHLKKLNGLIKKKKARNRSAIINMALKELLKRR